MNELLAPTAGEVWLLHAPPREAMLALVARLATEGPLLVLDTGNQFDAYKVARLIRRRTRQLDEALERVRVARAFTCYQVVALFAGLSAAPMPHVILDLPATFADESVSLAESRRLLEQTLHHVARLRHAAPLIISAGPSRHGRRAELLQTIADAADHLLAWESPADAAPGKLF